MKSIKEIENMSLEQLEAVSMDESIAVPEGFTSRLENRLDGRNDKVRVVRFVATAASAAILAGVGFGIAKWQDEPKDTYNDPYLACAELERAFEMISTGINQSLEMANSVISEK